MTMPTPTAPSDAEAYAKILGDARSGAAAPTPNELTVLTSMVDFLKSDRPTSANSELLEAADLQFQSIANRHSAFGTDPVTTFAALSAVRVFCLGFDDPTELFLPGAGVGKVAINPRDVLFRVAATIDLFALWKDQGLRMSADDAVNEDLWNFVMVLVLRTGRDPVGALTSFARQYAEQNGMTAEVVRVEASEAEPTDTPCGCPACSCRKDVAKAVEGQDPALN